MACISPICKNLKNFISSLKSPTYRDFMIIKIIKIQEIKISHLGTFKGKQEWEYFWLWFWILYYFIVSYA